MFSKIGKYTQYITNGIKRLNPFTYSFYLNDPMPISEEDFCIMLTRILFKRLILDTFTKLSYKSETEERLIEKNFIQQNQDGFKLRSIVWLLAHCIATQARIYLVYKGGGDTFDIPLRLATPEEEVWMDETLALKGYLPKGYYIFNGWGFEEAILINMANKSLYELVKTNQIQMKVASSPVIKAKDLTRNITLVDKEIALEQGRSIRDGIQSGMGSIIDAESDVVLLEPKTQSASTAFDNYVKLIALYLGMPNAWIIGLLTSGSLNGGESDNTAIERGLKTCKLQVIDPLLENLFSKYLAFKKDVWRYLYKMNNVLSWIEQSQYLTEDEKNRYIRNILP